jgi:hypothetical protein
MYDVHDVHDLDCFFLIILFFEISKRQSGRAHPGESKNALRVVEGAWGAELRTSVSRVITTRSSCINERLGCFFIFFDVELSVRYSTV